MGTDSDLKEHVEIRQWVFGDKYNLPQCPKGSSSTVVWVLHCGK